MSLPPLKNLYTVFNLNGIPCFVSKYQANANAKYSELATKAKVLSVPLRPVIQTAIAPKKGRGDLSLKPWQYEKFQNFAAAIRYEIFKYLNSAHQSYHIWVDKAHRILYYTTELETSFGYEALKFITTNQAKDLDVVSFNDLSITNRDIHEISKANIGNTFLKDKEAYFNSGFFKNLSSEEKGRWSNYPDILQDKQPEEMKKWYEFLQLTQLQFIDHAFCLQEQPLVYEVHQTMCLDELERIIMVTIDRDCAIALKEAIGSIAQIKFYERPSSILG
ncbi:MAG: hypothetical protein F6K63_29870 [Moorea sp. SIO1G6]|uniref:hypothetical protein n=1 Tax=Moorena sp. SIO1G6 TaxID=2607840 RepID=UPI0013C03E56|nr:hypothetical protein [Moorena sp. SIO1G6]NET68378.1 hypothetical protein [Moorena sp. SIO1G6]